MKTLTLATFLLATTIIVHATPGHAASPDCWWGTANSTYRNLDCYTGSEYVVFGTIAHEEWTGSMWVLVVEGTGVCVFARNADYSRGAYQEWVAHADDTADWRIRLDGASATGSADVFRLANNAAGSSETCRARSGMTGGVFVTRYLSAGDTYLVWGDKGDDRIYLYGAPTVSYTLSNAGRADGRDGSDTINGSNYANTTDSEQFWGGGDSSIDYIYPRCGDADVWAGDGDDVVTVDCTGNYFEYYIEGEGGWDTITLNTGSRGIVYGGDGDDTINGSTANDELHGGAGNDVIESGGTTSFNPLEYLYGDWDDDTLSAFDGAYYYDSVVFDGGEDFDGLDYDECECNYHGYSDVYCEGPVNCP